MWALAAEVRGGIWIAAPEGYQTGAFVLQTSPRNASTDAQWAELRDFQQPAFWREDATGGTQPSGGKPPAEGQWRHRYGLFAAEESLGGPPRALWQEPHPVARLEMVLGCGNDSQPEGRNSLSARMGGRSRWQGAEALAFFLMVGLADQPVDLDPRTAFQAVPGGLCYFDVVHSSALADLWQAEGPVAQTWRRWQTAKPSERGTALAPAIGGDEPLAAALAVSLLERRTVQQAQQEILRCLRRGTLHRGRGVALSPVLWEAVRALEAPPEQIAEALRELAASSPRPLPKAVSNTLEWAVYHPAPEVQCAGLIALAPEAPTVGVGTLLELGQHPKSAAAVRHLLRAYVEHWRRHSLTRGDYLTHLAVITPVLPSALDELKACVLTEPEAMEQIGKQFGSLSLYLELLRASDPELRRKGCEWFASLPFANPPMREAVERFVGDPFCCDLAQAALAKWDLNASRRREDPGFEPAAATSPSPPVRSRASRQPQ